MKTIVLAVLTLGFIAACVALGQKRDLSDSTTAAKGKITRACGSFGMPMTVVSDDGNTIVGPGPLSGELKNLTSLGSTNRLLAVYNRALVASEDGGCTWTSVEHSFGGNITAGRDGEAYIWSGGGRCLDTGDPTRVILRYQSSRETKISQMINPFLCLSTFVVEASNPLHLRAAGKYPLAPSGALRIPPPPQPLPELPKGWEKFENFDKRAIADSTDGGKTWQVIARYPMNDIPSEIFISSKNPDHILLSSSFKEGSVSFDGGKTWRGSNTEFSSVLISPVDDKIVWTTGIDPSAREPNPAAAESPKANSGEATRTESLKTRYWRLFQSHDGGVTFSNVVSRPMDDFSAPFFPSYLTAVPGSSEKVYFATTDRLYTYDSKTGEMLWTSANETDPDRRYLIRGILPMPLAGGQIVLALSISQIRQTNSNSGLVDLNTNLSRVANVNIGGSNVNNVKTPRATGETPKLPPQMPPAVGFHYMYHNGQTTLTTIDVKNGIVEYEHRDSGMSPTVKRRRTLSSKELEALYRVFVENKFDLIRNDPRVEYANDTPKDWISIDLGPRSYIQIVFDPIMSPLSGDSLKRFEAVKSALFKLLDLESAK